MVRSECVIKIIPGEQFTPYSLAARLGAKVILESSSFQKGKERYSMLMVKEAFQLIQDQRGIVMKPAGGERCYRVDSRARDILDVCQYFADQHAPVNQDFPFPAGGVGYLSYEFSRFCDNIKFAEQQDSLGLPDAAFLFGHIFIVFDHYTDKLYLIGLKYREAEISLELELAALEADILHPRPESADSSGSNIPSERELDSSQDPLVQGGDPEAIRIEDASDNDDDYMRGVEAVRDEVVAGNLLQGVLSRRVTLYSNIKPMDAYRHLRSNNPSPYLFYIDFGAYQLFGASPEVHVKVRDGKATLRPIAGTRRRGKTRDEDLSLEAELLADPKERAEHLMLVDLGRNDLGRICAPGSVKVTDYMTIERYSHVMHIVSQVEGQLSPGKTGLDAFRATFPAGTVSGAPKIRAIEILSRLEPFKRSFYAGAIGYMEPGGNLDTCIGIRCALKMGKKLITQAGAGIVFDSTPERELEETREKMSSTLRAVGVDPSQLFSTTSSTGAAKTADSDLTMTVGYTEATSVKRSPAKPVRQETSGDRVIQASIDNLVDEKSYADQAAQFAALEAQRPNLGAESWGGEEGWDKTDPLSGLDSGGDVDSAVENIVDSFETEELVSEELDPWAAADAEAAALSDGNSEGRRTAPAWEPEPEVADGFSGGLPDDDEIIPLDWDFDPSSATGAVEIQDDIDSIISSTSKNK